MGLLDNSDHCVECGLKLERERAYRSRAACPDCTALQQEQGNARYLIEEARKASLEKIKEVERSYAAAITKLKEEAEASIREAYAGSFQKIDHIEAELASRMPKIYTEGDLIVEFARNKEGAKTFTLRYWSVRSVGRFRYSQYSDYTHNAVYLRGVKSTGELGERKGSARWDLSLCDIDGSGGLSECFAVFRLVDGKAVAVYQQLDGVESFYPRHRVRYAMNPPISEEEKAAYRAKAEAIIADTDAITKMFPKE